jgi:hypothetical protein
MSVVDIWVTVVAIWAVFGSVALCVMLCAAARAIDRDNNT